MSLIASILALTAFIGTPFLVSSISSPTNTLDINSEERNIIIENKIENESDESENGLYTVTFDFTGGIYLDEFPLFDMQIEEGNYATPPAEDDFYRENCKFRYWITATNEKWDFENSPIVEDLTLFAEWKWDVTQVINDPAAPWGKAYYSYNDFIKSYYKMKCYGSSDWQIIQTNSTIYKPIEMKGPDFPREDISKAIETSGTKSTYGGCGPIAMMGIMDFFARYYDYSTIMKDPTLSTNRCLLAHDILSNTPTSEIGGFEKSTFTWPSDYVQGFTKVMKLYGLDKQITAKSTDLIFHESKDKLISMAKESIDKGIPVTLYAGPFIGSGTFDSHYVNLYKYKTLTGRNSENETISKTAFCARINGNWGDAEYYVDGDILEYGLCGLILYDVKNYNSLIKPEDFSEKFVNPNGQGQYYFYEKQADIITSKGLKLSTNRLRCGYIDNQFLVLSAKRENAGLAFLEMNYDISVVSMTYELALWSGLEGLNITESDVRIEYKTLSGEWIPYSEGIPIYEMSTLKTLPKKYYISFPEATRGIKFVVRTNSPSGDRNKGRIVLGDMNLFY